jgi:hypothetical protein
MFWRMEHTNMIQVLQDIEDFEDGDAAERYALALELEAIWMSRMCRGPRDERHKGQRWLRWSGRR